MSATAGISSWAARAASAGILHAPSRIEYSLWTWRWTKSALTEGPLYGGPRKSPFTVLARVFVAAGACPGRPDGIKWPAVRGAVTLLASSAQWQVGLVLGIVVVLVAATIVITIVLLALRIAKQAKTAVGAVEVVRQQTAELGGIGQINDSGVRILHAARSLRKVAVGK